MSIRKRWVFTHLRVVVEGFGGVKEPVDVGKKFVRASEVFLKRVRICSVPARLTLPIEGHPCAQQQVSFIRFWPLYPYFHIDVDPFFLVGS